MALDESAVSALLDALRVGEGTDLVRELAQWALQQLIDAEATEKIGADPWERSPERTTHRNGSRPKVRLTKAGDLHWRPRSCGGVRSSPSCSNRAAASTRRCTRW